MLFSSFVHILPRTNLFLGFCLATYQFIKDRGYVPYDTCLSYLACSQDSTEGFCGHVDTTCSDSNVCRTCNTFSGMGGACTEIDIFPNATVAEYGMVDEGDVDAIKTELYVRGPVAATVNAEPLLEYKGGIYTDDSKPQQTNHIVSIVGWGTEDGQEYWIVRNSWVSFVLRWSYCCPDAAPCFSLSTKNWLRCCCAY